MIVLFSQFLLWKVLTLVFLFLVIAFIPLCFVAWFFWLRSEDSWGYDDDSYGISRRKIRDQEQIHANKIYNHRWSIAIAIVGTILSINLVGTAWPENITPEPSKSLSGAAYWKLTQSFDNFVDQSEKEEIANRPVTRTNIGSELHRIKLLGWNPPKHFYVTFKDLNTNLVYSRAYVSKHCNASGNLRAGDEYNVTVVTYTLSNRPGEKFAEFQNLYGTFC